MENTVNQLTANPTNKLASSTIANATIGVLSTVSALVVRNTSPEWYDPETWAAVTLFLTVFPPYVIGWFTSDAPQVVVVVEEIPVDA